MASRIHLAAISDRKAFGFREQSLLPVASSGLPRAHLPFGQFLDLGFCKHAGGFSISPHPPTVPGLKTSGSTKRSFFRTRFLSPIIYRVALPQQCLYFLPEPQPQGSLRPIFRSAWRYDVLPPPSSAAILRRPGPKYS